MLPRRSLHTSVRRLNAVWNDFSNRSINLSLRSSKLKQSLFVSDQPTQPVSITRGPRRERYRSPEQIDDTFKLAYSFLEERASSVYETLKKVEDPIQRDKLLVKAEINNPEVQYNFQFSDKINNEPRLIDYNLPVYRQLAKTHWKSYDLMLLMQRLETLHAIPDTLPTLNPRAHVMLKFPLSTGVNKWIEPGEMLSSNVTVFQPTIKLQEFDTVDLSKQKYTILIVNPDEPDLENDSFKTTLCFALKDIQINDYNDNVIDQRKFTNDQIMIDYMPPVPEKNAGKQRFIVWVFRQPEGESLSDTSTVIRDGFDIRKFVALNKLDPIGAHLWRSEWDMNVANIREKYSLPVGRVFSRVRR